ncbi:Gfo/Idh/MocA family protein [Haloferax gibbonsii]|uniref:Oxidoreductase n=1 Tax=Haloferax gibbonsii TaxID=35746 RepID=A0A0K1IZV6_HALGI|nr:Gfo/Idh/MocA family oxidoreductase [Haloferax gibbonsii]AKU09828.1 oxidoreductase [Haloferax gibbonsii]
MTYTAGIIGAGGIAGMGILGMHDREKIGKEKVRASHAGGYYENEDIELVAVADVDESKLERFSEAWDLSEDRCYSSHEEMLRAEDLDVISVCTPTFLRSEHVTDAVEIGNPSLIWCEKPIASSVSDARAMTELCEENGIELLINHSFRFTDKLRHLRSLIRDEGILGEIHAVSTQFRMELLRNSTHLLDTLVFLLDARPKKVSGFLTEENEAVDALESGRPVTDSGGGGFVIFDDDTFASIDCTVPREPSSMTIQIIGEEGKLYLNNDDGEWRYWTNDAGTHIEEGLSGIDGAWTWDEDYRNAFPNAVDHIIEVLENEEENYSSAIEATRSLEIIVGFYISHYMESHVRIPLDEPLEALEVTSW